MAQNLIVALLVGCCFVYSLWTLAPKAPRSRLATWLLQFPLPTFLKTPVTAAARKQGGCGCDGCDGPTKTKPGSTAAAQQPLVFHPRSGSVLGAKRERNQ